MSAAPASTVAIELLKERSRDALVERLGTVLQEMSSDQAVAFLADLLLTMGADRDYLKQRLIDLTASRFGRSSEQSSADQLQLFAAALRQACGQSRPEPEPKPEAETEAETEAKPVTPSAAELIAQTNQEIETEKAAQKARAAQARNARREAMRLDAEKNGGEQANWPAHLPHEEVTHPVPPEHCTCPDCGQRREIIGYNKSWRLEIRTQSVVVVELTPIVACKSHHGAPQSAPVSPKPVDKGHLGFSAASRLLFLRLTHNLPVARIAEMMQADGVPVSEDMIHTLIRVSGERAKPLVEAIQKQIQKARLVNIDDTHTDVHEGEKERVRRRARVWLALGDEKFAYFFATRSWRASEAQQALGPLSGVLQGDGYAGFPRLAAAQGNTLAGCMSHLRRKLRKAVLAHDPRATLALALVNGMYRVDELAKRRGLGPDDLLRLRQERSVPMMAALLQWARDVAPTIETKGPLGQAWTYLKNQQEPLQVFLTDPTVTIDNNAAERGLRRITIGRKLWLFFRDQDKLEHVARLMSLVTTARLHGVNELAYLQWVLEQLARREWSADAATALLPDAWKAMREQQGQDLGTTNG
jgi:transposase